MKAPVAGFIVERKAAVGARVAAGAPLFVIADAKTARLHAKAEGDGALTIAPGANALLTSESVPGRTFSGKVVEVRRTESGAPVDIIIEVDNLDLALRAGMQVSARIEIVEREASLSGL